MTEAGAQPDPRRTISELLARVRRRWLTSAVARVTTRAALAASGVVTLGVAIDALLAPVGFALLGLVAVVTAAALMAAGWMLWPIRHQPSDRQVARFIEEHHPGLDDRLVSAAEACTSDRASGPFQALIVSDAARLAPDIDPAGVVGTDVLRRACLQASGAVTVLALALVVAGGPVGRAVQAFWLYAFPGSVALTVAPGDTRVPAGSPLRIEARLGDGPGALGGAIPVLTIEDGTSTRRVDMDVADEVFSAEVPSVDGDLAYWVEVGNVRSSRYRVEALRPPAIERIDVHYEYPAFSGLEPRVEEDGGDIYAPAGTTARVIVHLDKPGATGAIALAAGAEVALRGDDTVLEASLRVQEDGSYRVTLVDRDGLTNPGDTEYFIRVMDDRPPEVRIVRPAGDRQITSLEEVVIEARADDDYGIARFELVYSVRGESERVLPLGGPRGATTVHGGETLYVEDMDVEPGDFITYYARARDVGRGKRSSEARSDIFFLDVKPFEEEFVAAQSQAMSGGGGGSLDDLVAAQKAIIVATWKLERRATAGQSADDIGAVARAQGELKERTQSAAMEAGGRRRGGRRGGAPSSTDVSSPLDAAVAAMDGAQAALEALRTADAVPLEMEALNHLLKAQAEIRRRQVARQQAQGGGSGSSGAQQDLSALFDRELQRQQETNYETPSSGGGREQEPESEALKKVRELARRQDELARRQREIARQRETLQADELKRQLERLTRDQMELRRQAEELAQQMARQQQGGQPQGQSQTGPRGQQQGGRQEEQAGRTGGESGMTSGTREADGERLRDVLEDMRRAASELRREAPGEASARADSALGGLRELERALAGEQPAQQRREFGELQLESQQVAEAQRRIAREGARLDPDSPNGDSMRRLAGEKEQLADRVDALERRLEALARNLGETDERAREAASALSAQDVGGQIRESAEALRQAERSTRQGRQAASPSVTGDAPRAADDAERDEGSLDTGRLVEQDDRLAQTLESVARTMGAAAGTGDAESHELLDQLARLSEMRQRLEELEDQLARLSEQAGDGQAEPGSQPTDPGEAQDGRVSSSEAAAEADALEQEYRRQLQQTMDLVAEMQGERGDGRGGRGTPEGQQTSRSAPGTEAFKQDYASWEELRRDLALSLERVEASLSARLEARESADRLHAGADEETPDAYRSLVSQYYQALASKKPPQ